MASIANDKAMLDELINGSGDLHSLTARMMFDEIPDDMPLKQVKKEYHDLRQKAKGYEFLINYDIHSFLLKFCMEKHLYILKENMKSL